MRKSAGSADRVGFAQLLDLVPLTDWVDWLKIGCALIIQTVLGETLKLCIRTYSARCRRSTALPTSVEDVSAGSGQEDIALKERVNIA